MRILYHFPLSPSSRKIRIMLAEKHLDFDLQPVNLSQPDTRFIQLNPAAEVPVLEEMSGAIIADPTTITEYLEEAYPDRNLLGSDVHQRAEVRRMTGWFDHKFAREVTDNLVGEKILKRIYRNGGPNGEAIREGMANIHFHLNYITQLIDQRRWLAGGFFSLADITAASHLSALDYMGDVPWDQYPSVKLWYACIKSRPSFRDILHDTIPGTGPAAHYANLDF